MKILQIASLGIENEDGLVRPAISFEPLGRHDKHRAWVVRIKNQKLPRLSRPPSEATPKCYSRYDD
jgi:hypothetical protein